MNADALRRGLVDLVPRVRRFAYALTGARADADDLLQSTIERVLVKGVPETVALDRWVFRVCSNIWTDELRARKVRRAISLDAEGAVEPGYDGERELMDRMALREVGRAMDALSDEQRAALSLVVLEGFSYAQAADVLQTPIGTIMSRVARARAALSDALGPDFRQAAAAMPGGTRR